MRKLAVLVSLLPFVVACQADALDVPAQGAPAPAAPDDPPPAASDGPPPPSPEGIDPNADYFANAVPNTIYPGSPDFVLINLLKKDRITQACVRLALRPFPVPSTMTLPDGWTLSVAEVYPPSWDCSPSFRFGIPEQFEGSPLGEGQIAFGFEDGKRVPCTASVHAEVTIAGSVHRFDSDRVRVSGGCQ